MRHSIQFRLTIVSIFSIGAIILVSWILYHRGSFFLFEAEAKENLESLYHQVDALFAHSEWSDEELKIGFEGLSNPNKIGRAHV